MTDTYNGSQMQESTKHKPGFDFILNTIKKFYISVKNVSWMQEFCKVSTMPKLI